MGNIQVKGALYLPASSLRQRVLWICSFEAFEVFVYFLLLLTVAHGLNFASPRLSGPPFGGVCSLTERHTLDCTLLPAHFCAQDCNKHPSSSL